MSKSSTLSILFVSCLLTVGTSFANEAPAHHEQQAKNSGKTVLISNYWPRTNKTEILNNANGTLYSKIITRNHRVITPNHHKALKPGDQLISRAYFYNFGDGKASFTTDAVFSVGTDGGIFELGDSYYPDHASNPVTTWHGTHTLTYSRGGKNNGLIWGNRGGNSVNSGWGKVMNGSINFGVRGSGQLNVVGQTFSEVRLVEVFDYYTPEYGRNNEGVWGRGNGQEFIDVIHIRFHHGSKYPDKPSSACSGAEQYHIPGYSSIVVDLWLDREGVVIKQDNVLSETWAGDCIGSYNKIDKPSFGVYIDQ